MNQYNNKKVLIIGGSEGIGLAMAKEFVSHGAYVAIASRSEQKLSSAIKELKAITDDSNITSCVLDIT